ncbi:MAG: hypothetical protein U5O69_09065 [Candidatus Competibacteraceae bacterium]|nr:hypothetical protein [Candidatus Competibacteraceae bacterium]
MPRELIVRGWPGRNGWIGAPPLSTVSPSSRRSEPPNRFSCNPPISRFAYAQAVWLLRDYPGPGLADVFETGGASLDLQLVAEPETDLLFEALGWNESTAVLPVESEVRLVDGQPIGYLLALKATATT